MSDPTDEAPEGTPEPGAPVPPPEPQAEAQGESQGESQRESEDAPSQTITCPGCGSVYDRRYLTECCRYEAGQGYRCANCNHFLEREAQSD
jgi:hypothetical protein